MERGRSARTTHVARVTSLPHEPSQDIQKSKQSRDVVHYIDFLNRRNGELRLELTFYRECYRHAERFKGKIAKIS
jgi:hypothetical protein